ncbi:MAG: acyl-CoA thioesterase II [Proteobacteria bacterium]|nr:acyl-CoA thioesterase II [Pseudomonadota bacterium]
MTEALKNLLKILDLELLEQQVYLGQSLDLGFHILFGGQVLGQALIAASRTVAPDKSIHSLHAYFLRAGNATQPLYYEVDLIRTGKSFATRRVVAKQGGLAIFSMSASFHRVEVGLEHQVAPMPVVPGPDGLVSDQQLMQAYYQQLPAARREKLTADRAIEVRVVDPVLPSNLAPRAPVRYAWIKAAGKLPVDPMIHQAVLAYASDFGLAMTALQPHGRMFMDPTLQLASLDHSMWFHRPLRADEWFLHAMESPIAGSGRGFNRGQVFTPDGVLVASTAQEGLLRTRSPKS